MRQIVIDILIDLFVSLATELFIRLLEWVEIPAWLLV